MVVTSTVVQKCFQEPSDAPPKALAENLCGQWPQAIWQGQRWNVLVFSSDMEGEMLCSPEQVEGSLPENGPSFTESCSAALLCGPCQAV